MHLDMLTFLHKSQKLMTGFAVRFSVLKYKIKPRLFKNTFTTLGKYVKV